MKHLMRRFAFVAFAAILALTTTPVFASASFVGMFPHNSMVASTVPGNGDINPYGVAVVEKSGGKLVKGDVLVSNFNNSANLQGTGTTIVEISPSGSVKQFAKISADDLPGACPGGVGLTTALVVTSSGWVIVGSLPTSDGTSATAKAGCLIVLNSMGHVVETISNGLINGPWDMTAMESGKTVTLFVTNVLNGTVAANGDVVNRGNVMRIGLMLEGNNAPMVVSHMVIGSGFGEKTDPAALVIGPTGVGLGKNGTLYVADTVANRIAAIPNALMRTNSAGTGMTVTKGKGLNGPLGLAIAKNGDILTVNSNDGNLVETTPGGSQVVVRGIDLTGTGGGTLFGLAVSLNDRGIYYVNDGDNTLDLLH
jgi:parallel beta-helix repeat protein